MVRRAAVWRPAGAGARAGLVWRAVDWFFSGLLIAVSAGITAFTGYLLWRLFRIEPTPADSASSAEARGE